MIDSHGNAFNADQLAVVCWRCASISTKTPPSLRSCASMSHTLDGKQAAR